MVSTSTSSTPAGEANTRIQAKVAAELAAREQAQKLADDAERNWLAQIQPVAQGICELYKAAGLRAEVHADYSRHNLIISEGRPFALFVRVSLLGEKLLNFSYTGSDWKGKDYFHYYDTDRFMEAVESHLVARLVENTKITRADPAHLRVAVERACLYETTELREEIFHKLARRLQDAGLPLTEAQCKAACY